MDPNEVERLLGRFTAEPAPPSLKVSVLAEAMQRLAGPVPSKTPSRGMRLGAMVAVAASLLVVLGIFKVILQPPGSGTVGTGQGSPLSSEEEKRALDLVQRLADEKPDEREKAERALEGMGHGISALLTKEFQRTKDPEIRSRLQRVIDNLAEVSFDRIAGIDLGGADPPDLAWRPDGREMAAAFWADRESSRVRVFDVRTGKKLAEQSVPAFVRRVAYSPDGRLLAARYDGGIALYDSKSLQKLADLSFDKDPNPMRGGMLSFLGNDRCLYVCHRGDTYLLEVATYRGGALQREAKGRGYDLDWVEMASSQDGAWLVYSQNNGESFSVVNTKSWQKLPALASRPPESQKAEPANDRDRQELFSNDVWRGCAFAGDSRHLFLQSHLGELVVYDVGSWQKVSWMDLGKSCTFAPLADSRYIITARKSEPMIRAWRWSTGKEAGNATIEGLGSGSISRIQDSPEGNLVCVLTVQGTKALIYRVREKP